jgi:tRNA(fMet)-specific endonuclease VapC
MTNDDIGISVVTLLELAHGVVRADTPERREKRQRFLDELMSVVPPHPVTMAAALRAGRIDGESQANGIRIPFSDLLIGVTALEVGYAVATHNVRHFRLIPNLAVKPL